MLLCGCFQNAYISDLKENSCFFFVKLHIYTTVLISNLKKVIIIWLINEQNDIYFNRYVSETQLSCLDLPDIFHVFSHREQISFTMAYGVIQCCHCTCFLTSCWRCAAAVLLCRPGLRRLLSGGPDEAKASAARRGPEWEVGSQAGAPGAGPKEYHSPRLCHHNVRYQQDEQGGRRTLTPAASEAAVCVWQCVVVVVASVCS